MYRVHGTYKKVDSTILPLFSRWVPYNTSLPNLLRIRSTSTSSRTRSRSRRFRCHLPFLRVLNKQVRQENGTTNRHGHGNHVLANATRQEAHPHVSPQLTDRHAQTGVRFELFIANHVEGIGQGGARDARTDGFGKGFLHAFRVIGRRVRVVRRQCVLFLDPILDGNGHDCE